MPRKATWPPRLLRHATGTARVHWGGVDYWLGPHDAPDVQQRYAALLVQLAGGETAPAPVPLSAAGSVADVCAAFLRHAEETYSERGGELDQFVLSFAPLLRLCGTLPAADLDADRLEACSGRWRRGAG